MSDDSATFKIALGVHRGKVKNQTKNRKWLWRRLQEPMVDTSVNFAQYSKLDVDEKGKKKAQAGYYKAGWYDDGLRKLRNLQGVTVGQIDLDNVTPEQIDRILSGEAPICRFDFFAHTTRSHCPEKPRWRLLVFFNRMASLDETNAIMRLLSLELADDPDEGLEMPDPVSFRNNQIAYWPSVSRNQEYLTHRNDGETLDVDEFLAEHIDWQDVSTLPRQEAEKSAGGGDPNAKMEDPREKPGLIGAFCRAYPISRAIEEFLGDIYEPGDAGTDEARYTYLPGTGSNGAVVYDDDTILHSNHGSDPIEGSANAFDLVRIHKFGHMDDKAHGNTSPANMPSFKAMAEFAGAIPEVKADIGAVDPDEFDDYDDDDEFEDHGPVKDSPKSEHDDDEFDLDLGDLGLDDDDDDDDDDLEFDDLEDEEPKEDKKAWQANLRRKGQNGDGDIEPNANNTALICINDGRIAKAVAYDEHLNDPVRLRQIRSKGMDLPSKPVPKHAQRYGAPWEDADDMSVLLILSGNSARGGYEMDPSQYNIQVGVLAAAMQKRIHPIRDKIKALHREWVKRGKPTGLLDQLSVRYLGTPDTIFHRESSAMFCIAAVARVFEPGCKFDVMPIIEGRTGSGKSTFWKILGLGYADDLKADLHQPDRVIEASRGNWFLEMAEMQAAKKADSNTLKMQLSSSSDTHRMAYAKRQQTFPRQFLFVGTSNEDDYLTDPTSSRRYWVWKSPKSEFNRIDLDHLRDHLWQVWGEAYQRYLDMREETTEGELWLDLHSVEAIRERDQIANTSRKLTATEIIADAIEDWADTPKPYGTVAPVDVHQFPDEDLAEHDDDTMVVSGMVGASQAQEHLQDQPELRQFRNADTRTWTAALRLLGKKPGWTEIEGRMKAHGYRTTWIARDGVRVIRKPRQPVQGPLWIEAPEGDNEPEIDLDDLGLDDL